MSRSCGYGKGSMNFNLCTDCGYCNRKREADQKLAAEGKCTICKGEGSVRRTGHHWRTGAAHTYSEDCTACEGTGKLNFRTKAKRINKGKAVALFDEVLNKLVQAQSSLNAEFSGDIEKRDKEDKDEAKKLRKRFVSAMNLPKSKGKK